MKSRRGFASMSPERRKECARAGYDAAVEYHGKGFRPCFTSGSARSAGAKGNAAKAAKRAG